MADVTPMMDSYGAIGPITRMHAPCIWTGPNTDFSILILILYLVSNTQEHIEHIFSIPTVFGSWGNSKRKCDMMFPILISFNLKRILQGACSISWRQHASILAQCLPAGLNPGLGRESDGPTGRGRARSMETPGGKLLTVFLDFFKKVLYNAC